MAEASPLGRPLRWIISTKAMFLAGSIQPCVPNAPPWPALPLLSGLVTPCGSRTTHQPMPQPLPGVKPVVFSPE